jgi:hypothetical protein
MPFAIVTVQTESGDNVELALPLHIPSRTLAAKVMHDLGRTVGTGETFDFFIDTGHGDKLILPTATLGQLGIVDGQRLRIRRASARTAPRAPGAHAYLRTESGDLLALEANLVIIGRKDTQYEGPLDLDLADHDPANAVSRRHACIGRRGRSYYLLDLKSMNGTRLNGKDVIPGRKMPLLDGDHIEFGHGVRVTFVSPAERPGEAEHNA